MESFLIYLLKASALLGIFYLSYFFLLKKETSFNLNRKYLLFGLITAGVLPAIYFTKKVYVEASSQSYNFILNSSEIASIPVETPIDWWEIAGIVYIILTGFFLLRFTLQLTSVLRILFSYKTQNISGLKYLETENDHLPFSFFNYIVFNPEKHSKKDLELILEHEKIHVKQMHSADIILVNLVSCLLWFNPFAWLYKKSVEQNLEFIADRETVNTNAEIKEYQRALVKVSTADLRPALTNHFYQSFIKKRIIMLNKKSSSRTSAWKFSLVIPLLLAFMLLFNVKSEAHIINNPEQRLDENSETNPGKDLELIVTSKSSQENLDNLKKILQKYQVDVTYEDLKFSKGKLTNIKMNYKDLETGDSGNIHQEDENGIKGFSFFKNENETGFGELTERNSKPKRIAVEARSVSNDKAKNGKNPLYVVNGKTFNASQLKAKYIGYKSTPVFLSTDAAFKKYGKPAKGGAIIIEEGAIIRDFNKEMVKIRSDKAKFNGKYIAVGPEGRPNFMNINQDRNSENVEIIYKNENNEIIKISGESGMQMFNDEEQKRQYVTGDNKVKWIVVDTTKIQKGTGNISKDNSSTIINGKGSKKDYKVEVSQVSFITDDEDEIKETLSDSSQQSNPLIVVNKKPKKSSFDKNSIEPNNIAKINVLKGTAATEKYGKKAEDGVIEIFTKDFDGDTTHPVKTDFYVLHKNSNDENIENLKKMIKSGADIDTEFTGIKRNKNGDITAVSVSAKTTDGKMASASFQNSEGIPLVIIGLSKDGKLVVSSNYKNY